MSVPSADEALAATRHWLQRVVIGLGLCPFAAAPFHGDRILYRVSPAIEMEDVYRDFLDTLDQLFGSDPARYETALMILHRGLSSFDDYLDALAMVEDAVAAAGLEGLIQVASFHPEYLFDGSDPADPANLTNRSPLPMFHLIREEGLAAALESYPDPEQIPQRNVERMRALGFEGLRALLDD